MYNNLKSLCTLALILILFLIFKECNMEILIEILFIEQGGGEMMATHNRSGRRQMSSINLNSIGIDCNSFFQFLWVAVCEIINT